MHSECTIKAVICQKLLIFLFLKSRNINQGNQLPNPCNLENILQIIWRYASIEKIGTLFWRICIILKIKVGRGALNDEYKAQCWPVSTIFVPIQWTKDTWSDWHIETVNKLHNIENLAHMLSSTEWNVCTFTLSNVNFYHLYTHYCPFLYAPLLLSH